MLGFMTLSDMGLCFPLKGHRGKEHYRKWTQTTESAGKWPHCSTALGKSIRFIKCQSLGRTDSLSAQSPSCYNEAKAERVGLNSWGLRVRGSSRLESDEMTELAWFIIPL